MYYYFISGGLKNNRKVSNNVSIMQKPDPLFLSREKLFKYKRKPFKQDWGGILKKAI